MAGERRAFLARPIRRDPGGVRVDRQDARGRRRAHGPRPAQHHPVHCRGLLGPAQVRASAEPPQRRVRRQRVLAPQPLSGLIREQRPIREEVAASELHLDHGPVALAAGVATRPDRTQAPTVALADQAKMIEQFAPQHDPGHTGHRVLARLRHRTSDPRERPAHHRIIKLEYQRGSLHLSGAPLSGDVLLGRFASSQVAGHLSRQSRRARLPGCNIRVRGADDRSRSPRIVGDP